MPMSMTTNYSPYGHRAVLLYPVIGQFMQLDVKNAFLHGPVDSETAYMHQHTWFCGYYHPDYVCHLQHLLLVGYKQAPRDMVLAVYIGLTLHVSVFCTGKTDASSICISIVTVSEHCLASIIFVDRDYCLNGLFVQHYYSQYH
ncbi:hypothetical protein Tco_0277431 [Tanacetum coccineum]